MDGAKARLRRNNNDAPRAVASDTETLNFRVSPEFKREFKGYAVSHGISMVDLLKEGFELSKRKSKA